MKTVYLFLAALFILSTAAAQNNEYVLKKDFQTEKKKLNGQIWSVRKANAELKKTVIAQSAVLDTLQLQLTQTRNELTASNDSLGKAGAKIIFLEEQVDKKKHHPLLIIALAVLFVLLVLFYIIFVKFRKKADQTHSEMSDGIKQLEEKSGQEMASLKKDITATHDRITSVGGDLDQKISRNALTEENNYKKTESQTNDLTSKVNSQDKALESKISDLEQSLKSTHEAHATEHKKVHDVINGIKKDMETRQQELAAKINGLSSEIAGLKKEG
jgi:septal ring factor EnvC (AmiA/AmiB activator)